MLVLILFIVLVLAGFCMLVSEDLLHKTDLTIHSWLIVLLIIGVFIGSLLIYEDSVRIESIKSFTEGKYRLEEVVHSDTTYLVKKIKENE